MANTKIIFVLARLRIAPLASDWPGTFQEFVEGYGGEMSGPVTALEYVMEGNFVERYGKKISGKQPKIKLLIVIVV